MLEIYGIRSQGCLTEPELKSLLNMVSPGKRERLAGYVRQRDRQNSLLGDLLARFLISKRLNLRNSEIDFSYTAKGKPFLADLTEIQFSISHSGDWVVCAVDDHLVGIDVQQVRALNLDIARRYFSAAENRDLQACTDGGRQLYFFQLWSLRESYLKATGLGLSGSLKDFSITRKRDTRFGIKKDGEWIEHFHLKLYQLDTCHPVAVCASLTSFPMEIQVIQWQDCLDSLIP